MDSRAEHDSAGVKTPEPILSEPTLPERERDLVVKMPPKRVRAVKVRVVARTKARPAPIIYTIED